MNLIYRYTASTISKVWMCNLFLSLTLLPIWITLIFIVRMYTPTAVFMLHIMISTKNKTSWVKSNLRQHIYILLNLIIISFKTWTEIFRSQFSLVILKIFSSKKFICTTSGSFFLLDRTFEYPCWCHIRLRGYVRCSIQKCKTIFSGLKLGRTVLHTILSM